VQIEHPDPHALHPAVVTKNPLLQAVQVVELEHALQLAEQVGKQELETNEYFELQAVHTDDEEQDVHPVGQAIQFPFER
jgi:hypothetical protein